METRISECCGGRIVFNNATGDNVCSVCRDRAVPAAIVYMDKDAAIAALEELWREDGWACGWCDTDNVAGAEVCAGCGEPVGGHPNDPH